ncbi:MAG: aldehyde ferredoxin oxidoreductase N-terminal domain-containing protein [Desulfurivibrionaceae bacterium]
MYAYTGKILHVDMTTQAKRVQQLEPEFLKTYLGGVGLATRLAYDHVIARSEATKQSSTFNYLSVSGLLRRAHND